ncbi:MAG: hypothetical protein QXP43_04800 [Nitrososphaerota archaeon]
MDGLEDLSLGDRMSGEIVQDAGVNPEAVAVTSPGEEGAPSVGIFGRDAPIGESAKRGWDKKMSKKFYADVHWRKDHVVVADGVVMRFKELSDIPAQAGDELYVDAIQLTRYQEFEKLLARGIRIFYLKRTDVIKKYRETKSDENDVKALMRIPQQFFRELTENELKIRMLLHEYRMTKGQLKLVKQLSRQAGDEETKVHYNQLIRSLRRRKDKLAREIDSLARSFLPIHQISERLGINSKRCLYGRVALVQLLLFVDFSLGLRKVMSYCWLNKTLREAVNSLTVSVKRRRKIKRKEVREVLKTIKKALKAVKE